MRRRRRTPAGRRAQAGFSMVEMLMAAYILAIGILGLVMLQTYTLRAQAGSADLATAVQVGNEVLDQAEMIGRNSVNCVRNNVALPTLPAGAPKYFLTTPVVLTFSNSGQRVPPSPLPAFFTATSTAVIAPGTLAGVVTPVPKLGGVAVLTVVVQWAETQKASHALATRTVTLQRQINYATS